MGIDRQFLLLTLASFSKLFLCQEHCSCDSPNVKTVLFKDIDMQRDCWERTDVALLLARRLMQELIPRKVPLDVFRMEAYFEFAERTIHQFAISNTSQELLYAAYADTVGGYLKAYGLPLAKEAYYEGKMDYGQMRRLYDLAERLRASLGTDGRGWSGPASVSSFAGKVTPLNDTTTETGDPCETLITHDAAAPNSRGRDNLQMNGHCCPEIFSFLGNYGSPEGPKIPLPFLDDDESPRALAVPFRDRSLYSLTSPVSADILRKYYLAGGSCLRSVADQTLDSLQSIFYQNTSRPRITRDAFRNATETFEVQFYRWLNEKIIPHLNDETWYVGFGGVLQILETIRRKGFENLDTPDVIPSMTLPRIDTGSLEFSKLCERCKNVSNDVKLSGPNSMQRPTILARIQQRPSVAFYLCTTVLIILSFWLISCVLFVFFKVCRGRNSRRAADIRRSEEGDIYKRILDAEDTDMVSCSSSEDKILKSFFKRGKSSRNLTELDSPLSDLYEKFLTDDHDIAVSSAGISHILSDESGELSGLEKLVTLTDDNDELVICETGSHSDANQKGQNTAAWNSRLE